MPQEHLRPGDHGDAAYKDGNFMQVLDGEESTVRSLYAKIGIDPRHKGEVLLQQGALEERQFAGWSMEYSDLESK